jgi:hypothetical protein
MPTVKLAGQVWMFKWRKCGAALDGTDYGEAAAFTAKVFE